MPLTAGVAFVFYLVAVILVATRSTEAKECAHPVCLEDACNYGTPFWFTVGVCVVTGVGAFVLEAMWWSRFRPVPFSLVWEPYEQEEAAHRSAVEAEELDEYFNPLHQVCYVWFCVVL